MYNNRWLQENKNMPNKLKAGTERVSYIEAAAMKKALYLLSSIKGVTISEIIREATSDYLKMQDPEGELTAAANSIASNQSDDREERAAQDIDPEALKTITDLMKKFKKS